jgi:putative membrane protein
MIERTRASWLLAALALTCIQCGGEQRAPAAEAPMPPPAEPPAEVSTTEPVASAAAKPEPAPAPGEVPKASDAASSPSADAAKTAQLSDEQIAAVTDIANTAEIEQAKLARGKSKNAEVQKFSAMMIAHHGEAKQKQAKLKIKTADSPVSVKLLEDGNKTMANLKEKKGADFDRGYFEAQIEGHQAVLDALNKELLPSVKSPELRAYLEEIKPKVEQHLAAAQKAQQAIESSAGARGTSSSGTSMK